MRAQASSYRTSTITDRRGQLLAVGTVDQLKLEVRREQVLDVGVAGAGELAELYQVPPAQLAVLTEPLDSADVVAAGVDDDGDVELIWLFMIEGVVGA
jgi:hypothetical protein